MARAKLVDEAPKKSKGDEELDELHNRALAQFKASATFFADQRQREVDDLKFVDFDDQWEPEWKAQRQGNQTVNGLPPTPARPTLTINQLRPVGQQIASMRRQANLALKFVPRGGGANSDTAAVFEDIARAIQHDSRADIARNWAADRAEKAGLGWYRIDTDYCEGYGDDPAASFDQEIVYRRILNQASVYPDQAAQEPDFSDGRRLFITEDMPEDEYKAQHGDSKLATMDDSELQATGDMHKDWVFTSEGSEHAGRTIRVAEYWFVKERQRRKVELESGGSAFEDEMPEGATPKAGGQARQIAHRTVYWAKINGVEFLEPPREWNGSYIPVIPVVAEESNVGGERRWTGYVRPGRDAAISYNVLRSAQVETVGLATKAPYIGHVKVIEPFMEWWKQSNTRNFPVLPVAEAYDRQGNLLPIPQRNIQEPPIQAITVTVAAAKEDVHATTGIPPVALGQIDPSNRSGAAIKALQGQSEQGSQVYLDHLVAISLPYEGKVLRDLIPRIYDRPGRVVPAVGEDEQRSMVMLGKPFIINAAGDVVAVPDQALAETGWTPDNGKALPEPLQYIDLKKGAYSVTATAGKSYATRRQETSAAISDLLGAVPPEMAMALAPAWLEELDYPGAKKIAEIAKKSLPPQLAQAYQDGPDDGVSPQAKAQIQQLTQQVQQLTQEVQTKQMENQTKLQVAQMNNQTSMEETRLRVTGQLAAAQAKVDAENFRSYADALESKVAHDEGFRLHLAKAMAEYDAMHKQHGHDLTQTVLQHGHEQAMQAAQQQHESEMAQQQADAAAQQAASQGAPDNAGA